MCLSKSKKVLKEIHWKANWIYWNKVYRFGCKAAATGIWKQSNFCLQTVQLESCITLSLGLRWYTLRRVSFRWLNCVIVVSSAVCVFEYVCSVYTVFYWNKFIFAAYYFVWNVKISSYSKKTWLNSTNKTSKREWHFGRRFVFFLLKTSNNKFDAQYAHSSCSAKLSVSELNKNKIKRTRFHTCKVFFCAWKHNYTSFVRWRSMFQVNKRKYMQFFICVSVTSCACMLYVNKKKRPTIVYWCRLPIFSPCRWRRCLCEHRKHPCMCSAFIVAQRFRTARHFDTITNTAQFFFSTSAIIAHKTTRSRNFWKTFAEQKFFILNYSIAHTNF